MAVCPYGIGGSCMDKITFSVFWHDRETKAQLVHAYYRSSGVDRITNNRVSKNKRSWVAAAHLKVRI